MKEQNVKTQLLVRIIWENLNYLCRMEIGNVEIFSVANILRAAIFLGLILGGIFSLYRKKKVLGMILLSLAFIPFIFTMVLILLYWLS
ncbi:hypothetical protein JCM30204_22940 [Dysgonomonas termitidis]|uniref:Uncharacterized protein n=1 Tax=Dysgonomonas termitidis TaxID=1516126 RepID=A0ABV9L2U9_9BACT